MQYQFNTLTENIFLNTLILLFYFYFGLMFHNCPHVKIFYQPSAIIATNVFLYVDPKIGIAARKVLVLANYFC